MGGGGGSESVFTLSAAQPGQAAASNLATQSWKASLLAYKPPDALAPTDSVAPQGWTASLLTDKPPEALAPTNSDLTAASSLEPAVTLEPTATMESGFTLEATSAIEAITTIEAISTAAPALEPVSTLAPNSPLAEAEASPIPSHVFTAASLDISSQSARIQEMKAERRRLGLSGKHSPIFAPLSSIPSQSSQGPYSLGSLDRALRKAERRAAREQRRRESETRALRRSARDGDRAPLPHSNRHRHDAARKAEYLRNNLPDTAFAVSASAENLATPVETAADLSSLLTSPAFTAIRYTESTARPMASPRSEAASLRNYAEYRSLTEGVSAPTASLPSDPTFTPSTFTN